MEYWYFKPMPAVSTAQLAHAADESICCAMDCSSAGTERFVRASTLAWSTGTQSARPSPVLASTVAWRTPRTKEPTFRIFSATSTTKTHRPSIPTRPVIPSSTWYRPTWRRIARTRWRTTYRRITVKRLVEVSTSTQICYRQQLPVFFGWLQRRFLTQFLFHHY